MRTVIIYPGPPPIKYVELAAEERAQIKARRQSLRLSLKPLAYLVGVGAQTISRWERGVRRPSPADFERWEAALIASASLEAWLSEPGKQSDDATCAS